MTFIMVWRYMSISQKINNKINSSYSCYTSKQCNKKLKGKDNNNKLAKKLLISLICLDIERKGRKFAWNIKKILLKNENIRFLKIKGIDLTTIIWDLVIISIWITFYQLIAQKENAQSGVIFIGLGIILIQYMLAKFLLILEYMMMYLFINFVAGKDRGLELRESH